AADSRAAVEFQFSFGLIRRSYDYLVLWHLSTEPDEPSPDTGVKAARLYLARSRPFTANRLWEHSRPASR
ncbi:MAG TPA: hypothetical protein VKC34_06170, partial [Blastocatellia bacterium]|nr:hypothetical protein [Blastocatellia bacterium]